MGKIKKERKRRRRIAYMQRAGALVGLIVIIALIGFGGNYLFDKLKKDNHADPKIAYQGADGITVEENTGNSLVSVSGEDTEDISSSSSKEDAQVTENDTQDIQDNSVTGQETQFCVVIDAGHGGKDAGTLYKSIEEKGINLSVALKLKEILEENNIKVVLTRSTDDYITLSDRVYIANSKNADFFISIHCNYYEDDSQIAGMECYYNNPEATKSKEYAESIFQAVASSSDLKAREARPEMYYVLKNTSMPAVLVELGFFSNYSDRLNLQSEVYQNRMAEQIAEGILQELLK